MRPVAAGYRRPFLPTTTGYEDGWHRRQALRRFRVQIPDFSITRSAPKNRHSTLNFYHSLNNPSVTVPHVLSFCMFARYWTDSSRGLLAVTGFPAPQRHSSHSTPLLPMASGFFRTMDACIFFPFNRLRTLSISMGVYTPSPLLALPPSVRSASAQIAHFFAITPLPATLVFFMGGRGV
jgi:hypothetical protein